MRQTKLKKLAGLPKPDEHKSQKRNWFKYLPHALAFGVFALGVVYANRSNSNSANPPESAVSLPVAMPLSSTLPSASISILDRGLSSNTDVNFSAVNSTINSLVEYNPSSECVYKIGPRSNLDTFLTSIKNRLDSMGFRVTTNATSPRAILESLNTYYLDNNYWFMLRSPEETNRYTGASQRVVCVFRHPVVARSFLNYSYFGGNIHAENVPIYYVGGRAAFVDEGAIGGGLTVRTGVMIFSENPTHGGQDRTMRNRDFVIHEGIHYLHLLRGGRDFIDPIDLDLNVVRGNNSTSEFHLRDELRAYLIQMMYGTYPRNALNAALLSDLEQYSFARAAITESVAIYLREHDQVRYNKLVSNTLRMSEVTDDELRIIAHDTFVRLHLDRGYASHF